jgi:two-component system chemotaxis response regulator CheY
MPDIATLEADLGLLRSEVKDRTADLEQLFMALEQAQTDGKSTIEVLHQILRQAHSFKGSLGMADQTTASQAVHAMETAFVALREGRLTTSPEFFDLAFASLDQLSHVGEGGSESEAALRELSGTWDAMKNSSSDGSLRGHTRLPFPLEPNEAQKLRQALSVGHRLYLVEKSIMSDLSREAFDTLPVFEDIENIGVLIARRPTFDNIDRRQRETVLLLLVAAALDARAMAGEIFDPTLPVELSQEDKKTCLAIPSGPQTHKQGRLKYLVVEDDPTSRLLLQKLLEPLGESHVAEDGEAALASVKMALKGREPYQLICLDIMMPRMDGHGFLKGLRQLEEESGVPPGKATKVVMTTCLKDNRHIMDSFREQCDAYVVKPVAGSKLMEQLAMLGLLENSQSPAPANGRQRSSSLPPRR